MHTRFRVNLREFSVNHKQCDMRPANVNFIFIKTQNIIYPICICEASVTHVCVCVPVMMSQKRSDPFAMFNKINVKADRGRSMASGISQ